MYRPVHTLILAAVFLLAGTVAQGASIRSLSIHDLAENAEQIFEGQVIGSRVIEEADSRLIRTLVIFEIADPIKGVKEGRTVELSFLGGEIGGRGLRVSNQHIPVLGERGIYFVENSKRRQINPLVGWEQGHFLVKQGKTAGDGSAIHTRNGAAVYALEEKHRVRAPITLSKGIARGVITEPISRGAIPLSTEAFKSRIREIAQ